MVKRLCTAALHCRAFIALYCTELHHCRLHMYLLLVAALTVPYCGDRSTFGNAKL